ncbi:SET domain-containing protein-lysine N-methyltransferase [Paraburkholderia tagetis]|uniref:SET domain-containing protein-lysine N-methyltransferase n=1 Tax=Paraburkholderia tagetis TaxID=2913261 RepID=A0A9X1UNP4_9BURK|nr:SET domain-containing protein-lysine N-methyltransferase [Paraburkholderia tagetis]
MNADGKRTPCVIVRELRHGRGVFARRDLGAGEILLEYRGECVDQNAAFSRPVTNRFLLGLSNGRIINGDCRGNTARWINHSCDPNCVTVERKGRVFIRAARAIRIGREITIDQALGFAGAITPAMRARFVCHCGAHSCRGTKLIALGDDYLKAPDGVPAVTSLRSTQAQRIAPARIRVLERLPGNRIVVSWRQPGRACYSEQIWLPATATEAGLCALSMISFEAGARVFLPTGEPLPLNREERILADAIAALDPESAVRGCLRQLHEAVAATLARESGRPV